MDSPFTKINISMFVTYVSLLSCTFFGSKKDIVFNKLNEINRFLGAVTFNTSLAVALPWESTRFLYPDAAKHFLQKICTRYNISRPVFEFLNFVTHIFPVLYLWNVRKHWQRYSSNKYTVFLSLLIHGLWVKFVPKHYNLNRIYMYGDPILNDRQWLLLWILSVGAHTFQYTTARAPRSLKYNLNIL